MTRDDWPQFKEVVGAIYGFYRKEVTILNLRIWFEALKAYELATVRQAFSAHLRNPDVGQFMPLPADLVKLIEGGSNDAALLAWAIVDRAVRTIGTYTSVVFDDPLIHYAIGNMGGWIHLGTKTEEEWSFVRNQFVVLYRGGRMRGQLQYPSHLIGIAEAENGARSVGTAPPMFIGDRAKAAQVLKNGQHTDAVEARTVGQLLEHVKEAAA